MADHIKRWADMTLAEKTDALIEGAETARIDGDTVASLAMAMHAAELCQLRRALGES